MVDAARYYVALMLVVTFPPAFAFWFVVHPFIGFWRRLGSKITYAVLLPSMAAACYGLFLLRDSLLGVDFGTRWPLIVLGVALYGLAAVVERSCRRYLTLRTLVGIPEIKAPSEGPGKLLDEGIYGRVRHPRYLGVMLSGFGFAAFANHLGSWAVMFGLIPVTYALTVIEERELRARFGAAYIDYAARVPRLLPRFG